MLLPDDEHRAVRCGLHVVHVGAAGVVHHEAVPGDHRRVGRAHADRLLAVDDVIPPDDVDGVVGVAGAHAPHRPAVGRRHPRPVDRTGVRIETDHTRHGLRVSAVRRGGEGACHVEPPVGTEAQIANDRGPAVHAGVPARPRVAGRRIDLHQRPRRDPVPFVHLAADEEPAVGRRLEGEHGPTGHRGEAGEMHAGRHGEGGQKGLIANEVTVGDLEELAAGEDDAVDFLHRPAERVEAVDGSRWTFRRQPPVGELGAFDLGARRRREPEHECQRDSTDERCAHSVER